MRWRPRAGLLEGTARPIVLLRLREGEPGLAPSVAPGLAELGVMLPYTPLHHLLLEAVGGPLVMTSGNLSDEPIAIDNDEALRRLATIADGFLLHDRAVLRATTTRSCAWWRTHRAGAPFPRLRSLPAQAALHARPAHPGLRTEQKNTFCLAREDHAFVSQHIGDMENAETLEAYEHTIGLYEEMFRVRPELVAYDLHPEYLSTKYALSLGLPGIGVQHHHAHIASVTAEHGVSEPVVGLAFDGTGSGRRDDLGRGGPARGLGGLRADSTPARCPDARRGGRDPPARTHGTRVASRCGQRAVGPPWSHFLHETLSPEELTTIPAMVDQGINSP